MTGSGMDADIASFVVFSEQDADPKAPKLNLKLNGASTLSLNLPHTIKMAIERTPDDGDKRPIMYHWSADRNAFTADSAGFLLLVHTNNGLERVEIDHSGLQESGDAEGFVVTEHHRALRQLSSGDHIRFAPLLPERYEKALIPNKEYVLLWTGSELAWEWGTRKQHEGEYFRIHDENRARLVLPGGPHVSFKVVEEAEPWPKRAELEARVGFARASIEEERWRSDERRMRPRPFPTYLVPERNPEAPRLSVTLACPPKIYRNTLFNVSVTVQHHADTTARSITFHTWKFGPGCEVFHKQSGGWVECEDDTTCFMIVNEPDIEVNVSQDEDFTSLSPGESWTTMHRMASRHGFDRGIPDDAAIGDVFRHIFPGTTLDRWTWGGKDENAETIFKLPCFIAGDVQDPADNDGRAQLVVPPSEAAEFSLAELPSACGGSASTFV